MYVLSPFRLLSILFLLFPIDFFNRETDNSIVNFGDKIKELRKSQNLSQATVAEKMGISQSSYCDLEKRIDPELTIGFLSKALSVLAPGVKLFEFIADGKDLDGFTPSWLRSEYLEIMLSLEKLPDLKREKLLSAFKNIIEATKD